MKEMFMYKIMRIRNVDFSLKQLVCLFIIVSLFGCRTRLF